MKFYPTVCVMHHSLCAARCVVSRMLLFTWYRTELGSPLLQASCLRSHPSEAASSSSPSASSVRVLNIQYLTWYLTTFQLSVGACILSRRLGGEIRGCVDAYQMNFLMH